jgi:predicted O-methyltransferase YrrM
MKYLKDLVEKTVNGSGDSDQHIMTLFSIALASKSKIMIELGVRGGDTTIPLLEAAKINDAILYSVDINDTDFEVRDDLKPHWKFVKSDAIEFLESWDSEKTVGFFYVDDWHSYEHVKRELEIIDSLVSPSSVVLLHDLMYGGTPPFYHVDLTNSGGTQWSNGGPYRAVAELNPQFWEFSTLPWNNGLTLLRKKYSSKFSNK